MRPFLQSFYEFAQVSLPEFCWSIVVYSVEPFKGFSAFCLVILDYISKLYESFTTSLLNCDVFQFHKSCMNFVLEKLKLSAKNVIVKWKFYVFLAASQTYKRFTKINHVCRFHNTKILMNNTLNYPIKAH